MANIELVSLDRSKSWEVKQHELGVPFGRVVFRIPSTHFKVIYILLLENHRLTKKIRTNLQNMGSTQMRQDLQKPYFFIGYADEMGVLGRAWYPQYSCLICGQYNLII